MAGHVHKSYSISVKGKTLELTELNMAAVVQLIMQRLGTRELVVTLEENPNPGAKAKDNYKKISSLETMTTMAVPHQEARPNESVRH